MKRGAKLMSREQIEAAMQRGDALPVWEDACRRLTYAGNLLIACIGSMVVSLLCVFGVVSRDLGIGAALLVMGAVMLLAGRWARPLE